MWNKNIILLVGLVLFASSPFKPDNRRINALKSVYISYPKQDSVLKDDVKIEGSTEISGFVRSEIAFAYDSNSSNKWFLISSSEKSIKDGILTIWKTKEITDGDYRLRMQVFLDDGTIIEDVVPQLHIKNYTNDEVGVVIQTPALSLTEENLNKVTDTPELETTNLSANPLVVTSQKVVSSLVFGILGIILLAISWGTLFHLRIK